MLKHYCQCQLDCGEQKTLQNAHIMVLLILTIHLSREEESNFDFPRLCFYLRPGLHRSHFFDTSNIYYDFNYDFLYTYEILNAFTDVVYFTQRNSKFFISSIKCQ